VLNKVSAFLFQPAVRLSLGAIENRLDFRTIMDRRQVLIVDLGGLTGETQQLYGSLLVTGLEHAAMSRRNQLPEERNPFFCMIDEFPFFCARDSSSRKFASSTATWVWPTRRWPRPICACRAPWKTPN
jgi:hypothetical protein